MKIHQIPSNKTRPINQRLYTEVRFYRYQNLILQRDGANVPQLYLDNEMLDRFKWIKIRDGIGNFEKEYEKARKTYDFFYDRYNDPDDLSEEPNAYLNPLLRHEYVGDNDRLNRQIPFSDGTITAVRNRFVYLFRRLATGEGEDIAFSDHMLYASLYIDGHGKYHIFDFCQNEPEQFADVCDYREAKEYGVPSGKSIKREEDTPEWLLRAISESEEGNRIPTGDYEQLVTLPEDDGDEEFTEGLTTLKLFMMKREEQQWKPLTYGEPTNFEFFACLCPFSLAVDRRAELLEQFEELQPGENHPRLEPIHTDALARKQQDQPDAWLIYENSVNREEPGQLRARYENITGVATRERNDPVYRVPLIDHVDQLDRLRAINAKVQTLITAIHTENRDVIEFEEYAYGLIEDIPWEDSFFLRLRQKIADTERKDLYNPFAMVDIEEGQTVFRVLCDFLEYFHRLTSANMLHWLESDGFTAFLDDFELSWIDSDPDAPIHPGHFD